MDRLLTQEFFGVDKDRERRLKKTHRLLAFLWTTFLLLVCFLPARWMPVAEKKIDSEARKMGIPIDKVVHFGMFGGFAWLWSRNERTSIRVAVLAAGLGLAVFTESLQNHPLIARDGEVFDALADSLGVFVGIAVASIPPQRPKLGPDEPA